MVMKRAVQSHTPMLRVYLRRSKADEGHQQFSLDVQREGAHLFAANELASYGATAPWSERVEYIDDDRAGDDFAGRVELQRLRNETKAGDLVLCRDQSRLGRDALEVTLVVRDLVRDRGARLFYYSERKEVEFANAIDAAMTFIKGTGHQMELEAIRSRVKEALRSRARAGRIAGGRCFGFALKRETDASGRGYTIAVVDQEQAKIVVRIFTEYLEGAGLKRIASGLNDDRIPPPHAGKRGTGSWSPGCIRVMLRNQRYRGIYIHGRLKRIRRGGKRIAVEAPAEELITVDIPEWKIVDDSLWFAVQEKIEERATVWSVSAPGPAARHPISGVGRCVCRGAIGSHNTKIAEGVSAKVYACDWHARRGNAVCGVKVRQRMEEVELAVIEYLNDCVLTEAVANEIVAGIREELQRQFTATKQDTTVIEQELSRLRAEQRNLATAVATGGDAIPELLAELRKRNERIRLLDTDLAAAKRTPQMAAEMLAQAEKAVREKLGRFRHSLTESRADVREVFTDVFREGLLFKEAKDAQGRRVWSIEGWANLGACTLNCDPTGT